MNPSLYYSLIYDNPMKHNEFNILLDLSLLKK